MHYKNRRNFKRYDYKQKLSTEEQLEKLNDLFKKHSFVRIIKKNVEGDYYDFIILASKSGIELVEEDDKTMLFAKCNNKRPFLK